MTMRVDVDPFPGGLAMRTLRYLKRAVRRKRVRPRAVVQLGTVESAILQTVHIEARRPDRGNQLWKIFRGLERFQGLSIYVHGSWADNTRTPFSDLDDLIVYRRRDFERPVDLWAVHKWLNKVDMRLCRIDPLQHHGHWLIAEDELLDLDESYIPISVLQDSLCLQGSTEVVAVINRERTFVGLKRNVNLTLTNIDRLFSLYRASMINLYDMKCLVGSLLLTPAYLFHLGGNRVTKRYAIENACSVLTGGALTIVQRCEIIRANWGKVYRGMGYRALSCLPYLLYNPHVYRKVASIAAPRFQRELFPELSDADMDEFLSQCDAHVRVG